MAPSPSRPIRLLNVDTCSLETSEAPYAILSHRWGPDGILYKQWEDRNHGALRRKEAYKKITGACKQAQKDGLDYIWVDTICINKADNSELSESIKSMYAWYQNAEVPGRTRCYALLSDVGGAAPFEESEHCFHRSAWFTRGWTLQELLAPRKIFFFARDWNSLGDLGTLLDPVAGVTNIPQAVLRGDTPVHACTIAQRLSWASGRVTHRPEDQSYALLGILEVNMCLSYGEGQNAFVRLQEQLVMKGNGLTVLAWTSQDPMHRSHLFASSPADFASSSNIEAATSMANNAEYSLNNVGLTGRFPVLEHDCSNGKTIILIPLYCYESAKPEEMLALRLKTSLNVLGAETLTCSVDATQTSGGTTPLLSRLSTTQSFSIRSAPRVLLTIRYRVQDMETSQSEGNLRIQAHSEDTCRDQDPSSIVDTLRRPVSLNLDNPKHTGAVQRDKDSGRTQYSGIATGLGAFVGAVAGVIVATTATLPRSQDYYAPQRSRSAQFTGLHRESSTFVFSDSNKEDQAFHNEPEKGTWRFDDRRQMYNFSERQEDKLFYQDGLPVTGSTRLHPAFSPPSNLRSAPACEQDPSASRKQAVDASRSTTGQGLSQAAQNEPVLTRTLNAGGVPVITSTDRSNLVETRVASGPQNLITDPVLLASGFSAQRALYGTKGSEERLFSTFKVRENPRRFFKVGRVFLILWTEPAGAGATEITSYEQNDRTITAADGGPVPGRFGESVYSQVRRYVVIRGGEQFCSALPIHSYGGQGVGMQWVRKSDHVIIYTSRQAPLPLEAELPRQGETDALRSTPIRVVPDSPADILSSTSRLDLAKVHTIHHDIKVKPFGEVHPNSMEAFRAQFASVWRLQSHPITETSREEKGFAARAEHGTVGAAGANDSDASSDASKGVVCGSSPPRRRASAATTARPHLTPSAPTSPVSKPAKPTQASNTAAHQAQDVRSKLATYMQQGHSKEQAFELVVRRSMVARPELGRQAVVAILHSQLSTATAATAGPSAMRSRAGNENIEDDSSDADEDESDDDDKSDADGGDSGRRGEPTRR
ncbi:hypothetical protein LTR17_013116 [Elasticomyces elasticus]|nr:hypothetical protein LTR17_013116 [Elasticomyces elasticus]